MVFKFLDATTYHISLITSQDTKLPGMERQPNVKIPSQLADSGELPFTIRSIAAIAEKVTPSGLSIHRQDIAAKTNHPKASVKGSDTFHQPPGRFDVTYHEILQFLLSNGLALPVQPRYRCGTGVETLNRHHTFGGSFHKFATEPNLLDHFITICNSSA
jgi:hypothetical protein